MSENQQLGLTEDGGLDMTNPINYENGVLKPEALQYIGLAGFDAKETNSDGSVTYARPEGEKGNS